MTATRNVQRSQRLRPPARREHVPRRQRQGGPAADPHSRYERCLALAREAAAIGDAVQMENWDQHAEHYLRIMRARTT